MIKSKKIIQGDYPGPLRWASCKHMRKEEDGGLHWRRSSDDRSRSQRWRDLEDAVRRLEDEGRGKSQGMQVAS
jgi:hypothetical protein